jgi:succinate dehydrogenase/fumarate reductase cytochrome b subunit (b558 family)
LHFGPRKEPLSWHQLPIPSFPGLKRASLRCALARELRSCCAVCTRSAASYPSEPFFSNTSSRTPKPSKARLAYGKQVEFLNSLPFVFLLELFFIWIPILYHGLYGVYIWYQGDTNVADYPWTGNWLYTSQRWTGIIALIYMVQHTYYLRFTGVHLPTHPMQSFAKVQGEFQNPWMIAFYAVGIIAASWHFSYGLWLFAAKWGITTGERARRRLAISACCWRSAWFRSERPACTDS